MFIVQKYGGSSVADSERVLNVAKRIVQTHKEGNKVVVVLSAQGDTTDELIKKACEVNPNPSKREMDMLLSTGEQISVALMSMAIQSLGVSSISLNAMQLGIETKSDYSNARISHISTERINQELENNNIVIVTGFQGVNQYNDITTLGRGGSDTSAVAIAAAMNADICQIYTDVDGIYTADPRKVKDARKLDEISYDEMLELATLGAKVLHNRSVELARKYKVNLMVCSSLNNNPGTLIKDVNDVEKMAVSGVTSDENISRITVIDIENEPCKAFELFNLVSKNNIVVDIIIMSYGRDGKTDISFTVDKTDYDQVITMLNEHKATLGFRELITDNHISKISIVGAGMVSNSGVAVRLFEALCDEGINIEAIGSSEMKLSVIVKEQYSNQALNAVHRKFRLGGR